MDARDMSSPVSARRPLAERARFVWMLCVSAFCCSLVVAGVSTLLIGLLSLMNPLLWVALFFVAWGCALAHALLLGVPIAAILHWLARADYRSMAIAGAVVGFFPLLLLGVAPWSAALFSAFGTVGGIAFHRALIGQRMQGAREAPVVVALER